jgi:hypothetical protein
MKDLANNFFQGESIWRIVANFWTVVFIGLIIINFFSTDRYDLLIGPFSILYAGVLTIYVGTKEFDRWYREHESRHPGEIFVIVWTILILGLFAGSIFLEGEYRISSDIIAVYIAVMTLFAFTQKSKNLHKTKKKV